MVSKTNSNYAADAADQKSVTGHSHTLGGMITNWASQKQKTVALSSTEAEYIAMAECAQESVFTRTLVAELMEEKKTTIIYGNNIGLLFLTDNKQMRQHTKHINVRHHYLQELAEQKEAATRFQRLEHNHADVMTKNVTVQLI